MENVALKQEGRDLRVGLIFMILAACCTSVGQLFWKLSNANFNFQLVLGFFLYFLGAVLMIIAFRFGKLSVLHPFLSLGYIISIILGAILLNESLSAGSLIGIGLIIAGVVFIGGE